MILYDRYKLYMLWVVFCVYIGSDLRKNISQACNEWDSNLGLHEHTKNNEKK